MPELPEVETVARQLAPLIGGRKLLRIEIFDTKLGSTKKFRSFRGKIESVSREGKQVRIAIRGSNVLLIHLRMTGRLIWTENVPRKGKTFGQYHHAVASAEKTPRARLTFQHGAVAFYDTRRFGTFTLRKGSASSSGKGIDPTGKDFQLSWLLREVTRSRQPLKTWLLRQDRLVGIGNIYASEILWAAALSPLRSTASLSESELKSLYRAIRSVLTRAIRFCGTTFSDFQDTTGTAGSFQRLLRVYDREGLSCRRCKGKIRRVTQQQRSTYYCANCQS